MLKIAAATALLTASLGLSLQPQENTKLPPERMAELQTLMTD